MKRRFVTLFFSAALFACSSSSTPGGPVKGPEDAHCGSNVIVVDPAACMGGGTGGAGTGGAGTGGHGGDHEHGGDEYGATMYNSEGDDDECKYHMAWSSTEVAQNKDITFTLKLTYKNDGTPALGADPFIEAFLDHHTPAPQTGTAVEKGEGAYDIAPVQFNAAGRWTVRFHLYGICEEGASESTPHGHGAFYVDVP